MSGQLLRLMASELLGREMDEAYLADISGRLDALLGRLSGVNEATWDELVPAGTFHAANPAWTTAPAAAPPWQGVGPATPGSSGYGTPTPGAAAPQPPPQASPGPHREIAYMPLHKLAGRIRAREISPREAVSACLERIQALNGPLNAYITVLAEGAAALARSMEVSLPPGPLAGVPLALKDIIETAGIATTGGSAILKDHVPQRDAPVVTRLKRAGAIIVGKTNTHEFAFGPTNENPHFGPCRNPWDLSRIPGGSSGGSGAAVAAGLAHGALGTDTGGSVRCPAALCGIVGLKPTYGRVPKAGVFPLSWSLDHVGPMARTVTDVALLLQVLAGPDPADPTTVDVPVPDYVAACSTLRLKGRKIGIDRAWLEDRVAGPVQSAIRIALQVFQDLGATVVDVKMPPADVGMLINRLITLPEAASYHALMLRERAASYGADVRARLEMGQFLLARHYLGAQRLRGEFARHMHQLMTQVDAVITPAEPCGAPPIGQPTLAWGETTPDAMIRLLAPISVSGNPAISLPCGFDDEGLPIGMQVIGRPFEEDKLLAIAAAYEKMVPQHFKHPLL